MKRKFIVLLLFVCAVVSACSTDLSGPGERKTPVPVLGARQLSGASIVQEGVQASGTSGLAELLAESGNTAAAEGLLAMRRNHARFIDSIIGQSSDAPRWQKALEAKSPIGFITPSFDLEGEDEPLVITLSTAEAGPEVLNPQTMVTGSGRNGIVAGGATFKGAGLNIILSRETENHEGNLPHVTHFQRPAVQKLAPMDFATCVAQASSVSRFDGPAVIQARIRDHCNPLLGLPRYAEDSLLVDEATLRRNPLRQLRLSGVLLWWYHRGLHFEFAQLRTESHFRGGLRAAHRMGPRRP